MKIKKNYSILVVALLVILASMRFYAPSSDIPSSITISGSIYTDEGNQCHNSRSKVLFNEWFPDNWKITCYNPFLPYIKLGFFKLFGTGMVQQRVINYIFSLLSLIFFYFTVSSYLGKKYGVAALTLLGINFIYLMYNRIGTFETSLVFWMILTLYFIEKFRSTKQNTFVFFAGVSAFMAFIFKNIALYFLPAPIIAVLLWISVEREPGKKDKLKGILYLLAGIIITWGLWFYLFYLPNREWILSAPGKYMSGLMLPTSSRVALKNILNFPWKEQFQKIPVIWISSLLFIPVFFRKLIDRKASITENGYLLLFFANTFFLSFMSYRPTRYFLPVIPAMVFMSVCLWKWLIEKSRDNKSGIWKRISISIFDGIWFFVTTYLCFSLYTHKFMNIDLTTRQMLIAAIIFTLLPLKWLKPLTGSLVKPLVILLFLISVLYSGHQYYRWMSIRTNYIEDVAQSLNKIENTAWIAGLAAPAAVMDTKHRSLFLYPNFVNFDKPFERYDLTHALLETGASREIKIFFKRWKEKMENTPILAVYPLKDYNMHLYSFKSPYLKTWSQEGIAVVINPQKEDHESELQIFNIEDFSSTKQKVILKSGINKIETNSLPTKSKALKLKTDKLANPFTYFGGNFRRRTGEVITYPEDSSQRAISFNRKLHKPGYLAFGPGVPFSAGAFEAEFYIEFTKVMTRIKPMVTIDAVDARTGEVLDSLTIKPKNMRVSKKYPLKFFTRKTRNIDFRIKVANTSNLIFRKMELTYNLLKFSKDLD